MTPPDEEQQRAAASRAEVDSNSVSPEEAEQAREPRRGSLLVIFLTVFVDLLGFGIVLPLLPIYADRFTLDESGWQLGLLMASYSAMQFLFAPLWGRLSDHIGRRPVLMIGLSGSVAFYTGFGVATIMESFWLLLVCRIGAGIAGATIPTAQAYIADTTSLEKRSKGMALIGMAFGLGFTFGPILGFLAVPTRDAQPGPWPGYVAALLSAVALVMAIFWLPESRTKEQRLGATDSSHPRFDRRGLQLALRVPSIGLLLFAIFVCLFSFSNFETTLSLLIKGGREGVASPFEFSWGQVCLTYAYIGFTLALVQGGIVRRLSGRIADGTLAATGAGIEILGFGTMVLAILWQSAGLLLGALAIVVAGFSFMQPSLNALLSRRTSPDQQGAVLGVGQSVNSLARIAGSGLGIPLLRIHDQLPYLLAAGLMVFGLIFVVIAARSGRDYATE